MKHTLSLEEVIQKVMNNPAAITEQDIEDCADSLVYSFGASGLTYGQSNLVLEKLESIFKEARYHLGHNALYEMQDNPIKVMTNN